MQALWSCKYLGDSALKFVDVKAIQSVVVMVPHSPSIDGRAAEDRFFLVEKPGFDVALMSGVEEDMPAEEIVAADVREHGEIPNDIIST